MAKIKLTESQNVQPSVQGSENQTIYLGDCNHLSRFDNLWSPFSSPFVLREVLTPDDG